MASRWAYDINQNCSFCFSNISHGNVDIQKSVSTQHFFSKFLMGTLGFILTKIMAYFEDKTISKEKTSAPLLNTHLEHDTCNKHIMQQQQDILQVFVYYYVLWGAIFSQHPLPGLVGISNSNFKRKKLTKMLCFRYQHLVFTLHREVTLCLRDTFGNIFYT